MKSALLFFQHDQPVVAVYIYSVTATVALYTVYVEFSTNPGEVMKLTYLFLQSSNQMRTDIWLFETIRTIDLID